MVSRIWSERAAQLAGAIVSLRATLQVRFDVPEQAEFDRMVATLRAKQEEAAFNAAWAHRQALSIEDDAFAVFMAAPDRP